MHCSENIGVLKLYPLTDSHGASGNALKRHDLLNVLTTNGQKLAKILGFSGMPKYNIRESENVLNLPELKQEIKTNGTNNGQRLL